ncbi:neutral/alkaline non-lysosomal ceramidase N-terminal domain-containing protein [Candidatus Uabimicrobium sp. HlEnr_7]|uniref:neutral/alkaline non-lysosomal ceramidase N-terminal domain-containing protein n=1 Tax=Candidatus Uabimicrobium helgolandensis TaxID=3095367 RepID=UPI003556D00E
MRSRMKIFVLGVFLFGCSGGYKQQPVVERMTLSQDYAELYCGTSRVALTPYKNTSMAGYAPGNRIASGTYYDKERELFHHLYSRAVVLHNKLEIMPNKKYMAYVSVDLLILTDELTARVRKKVGQDTVVNLCATHPHSAIGGYWCCNLPSIAMGSFDEENLQYLAEKISQSILEAKNKLKPAQIGITYSKLENTTKNRRRKKDPVDTRLTLMHIKDKNNEIMADMVWFAGHPILMPPELWKYSSDFPGAFARILEKEQPSSYVALFFQGGLGDVTTRPPRDLWKHIEGRVPQRMAKIEIMGELIANKVKEARKEIQLSSSVRLQHYSPQFLLGNVNVNAIPDFLVPLEIVGRIWVDWGYMPERSNLEISTIDNSLHKIALANFPFEISSKLTIDLRKKLEQHYDIGIVTSLANGWYSYLMHSYSAMWPPSGPEYIESFFDPGYAESVMDYAYRVAAQMSDNKTLKAKKNH